MAENNGYKLDITLVIDSTGGMQSFVDRFGATAGAWSEEVVARLRKADMPIETFRIRVIDFGDFASECDDAIRYGDFYSMPYETEKFVEHIQNIQCACRGGDMPENALEALTHAILGDWEPIKEGEFGGHMIVLLTDALPLCLGERIGCMGYTDEYPSSVRELEEVWNGTYESLLDPRHKQLVLCAPSGTVDGRGWEEVKSWANVEYIPVAPAQGLADLSLDTLTDAVFRGAYRVLLYPKTKPAPPPPVPTPPAPKKKPRKVYPSSYYADMVYVIDVSARMRAYMPEIREKILDGFDRFEKRMKDADRLLAGMRARVISFTDFALDGADAVKASRFYSIPKEKGKFAKYLQELRIAERGDEPLANGLEALCEAMQSDWVQKDRERGKLVRQIIFLITDSYPLRLHERVGCHGYAADEYPRTAEELEEVWTSENMTKLDLHSKRLCIVLPTIDAWECGERRWGQVAGWEDTVTIELQGKDFDDSCEKAVATEIIREH